MNISSIIQISIGAILINNFILVRMLGLCPFFFVSRDLSSSFGMGMAVTFVMGVASAAAWIITTVILIPYDMAYLQLVVFILIIATFVQLTDMALQKWAPKLNDALGMYLPHITANCAVLAAALLTTQDNPFTGRPFSFVEACANGVASGIGFTIVLILMAGIREKLELSRCWRSLEGLPIAFITAGLMAMAFLGFMGLHVPPRAGGF